MRRSAAHIQMFIEDSKINISCFFFSGYLVMYGNFKSYSQAIWNSAMPEQKETDTAYFDKLYILKKKRIYVQYIIKILFLKSLLRKLLYIFIYTVNIYIHANRRCLCERACMRAYVRVHVCVCSCLWIVVGQCNLDSFVFCF